MTTPEERFLVEQLADDDEGRPGWGLRDQATRRLVTAGGEIDRYGTPDQARMHIQSHWYHALRTERHREVEAHIEQFATDAAHRRDGGLGPRREQRPRVELPEAVWARSTTSDAEAGHGRP